MSDLQDQELIRQIVKEEVKVLEEQTEHEQYIREFKDQIETLISPAKLQDIITDKDVIQQYLRQVDKEINLLELGLQAKIKRRAEDYQALIRDINDIDQLLNILQIVEKVKVEFQLFDNALQTGDHSTATSSMLRMKNNLGLLPQEEPKPTIFHDLQEKCDARRTTLISTLQQLCADSIRISPNKLLIFSKFQDSSKRCIEAVNVIHCLLTLDALYPKLQSFAKDVYAGLFRTIIEGSNSAQSVTDRTESTDTGVTCVIEVLEDEPTKESITGAYDMAGRTLTRTSMLLNLIFDKWFCGDAVCIQQFGQALWPALSKALINHCMKKAIPDDITQLASYQVLVNHTNSFENKLASKQFIDEQQKLLSTFVDNVDAHFADKKREQVLTEARRLLLNKEYITVDIKSELHETEAGLFQFPLNCKINATTRELVQLAYRTLDDATSSSFRCGHKLYSTVRDIFDMFLSMVPIYHVFKLESVAQIAIVFHNDCMYIAYHLVTMAYKYKSRLPPTLDKTATFIDMVPSFRSLEYEYFGQLLAKEQSQLMESLSSAKGLGDTHNPERFAVVNTSVNQIVHQLHHITKTWKDILPYQLYAKAFGTLLYAVVTKMIDHVESLRDIGEEETHKLNLLFSLLIKVFPDDEEQRKVIVHVSQWDKFCKLSNLLILSLVEIEEQYNGGAYTSFSASELHSLIISLFSDTPKRKRLLQLIK